MIKFSICPASVFVELIQNAKAQNIKYGYCLDIKTEDFYRDHCICFVVYFDGLPFGYAISNYADFGNYTELISVFKHPGIKLRVIDSIIKHAIANGATHLDCFATIKNQYEKHGFLTIYTENFTQAQAPADWNSILGFPAVHYMHLQN